jgi:hypothetical protein
MEPRFAALYGVALAVGIVLLWWFVFPDWPEVAVEDGLLAGAVASVVTGIFGRTA